MRILKGIGESFNNAVDYLAEKKRKFDKINRLKRYIKQETSSVVKNYIVLGKYYYKELRDVPNKEMQRICTAIDNGKCEIKRLKCKLEEVKNGCDIKFYCDSVDDVDICDASCCDEDCISRENCCGCEPVCDCQDSSSSDIRCASSDECNCCRTEDSESAESIEQSDAD